MSAAGGGIVSLLACGIIIVAMSMGAMGGVSAWRETKVVFAALIGQMFLHERLTAYRITAGAVVAAGALCIGHDGGHPSTNRTMARQLSEIRNLSS